MKTLKTIFNRKMLLLGSMAAVVAVGSFNSAGAQSIDDSFFEKVIFRGAFGNKVDWTQGWANFNPNSTSYGATTVTINAGDISSNTTWTKDKIYKLDGWVYVTSGATLTIEAGTVIRGDKANKGSLIIEPGGKIIAEGTESEPIVFTSGEPAGSRAYGDWGGLVICGNAKVNKVNPQIEGGPRTHYGGTDDNESSGTLKYVRIEFPGIAFQPDKEINGLTFGGVGSGTTVDYVQVSYSGDDSYEWFGGTVNLSHIIAFRGWDDDFDTDYGFRGHVQFAVSLRDPDVADPGSGSNGFESDNDGSGSADVPLTQPVFSNVSMFGPLKTSSVTPNSNYKRGMHLRRNSKINIFNSTFAGYVTGLYIEGPTVVSGPDIDPAMRLEYNVMAGNTDNFGTNGTDWSTSEEQTWWETASFKNELKTNTSDLDYVDPFNLTSPNFLISTSSFLNHGSYWDDGSIGINDVEGASGLSIYPNPANDVIVFGGDVKVNEVSVYNNVGQLVKYTGLKSNTLNISGLENGFYVVRATDEKGVIHTDRITKQ